MCQFTSCLSSQPSTCSWLTLTICVQKAWLNQEAACIFQSERARQVSQKINHKAFRLECISVTEGLVHDLSPFRFR